MFVRLFEMDWSDNLYFDKNLPFLLTHFFFWKIYYIKLDLTAI